MSGGGLYSTVGDYLKFTQMILRDGKFNGVQVLEHFYSETNLEASETGVMCDS